jgi:hypothetical protein
MTNASSATVIVPAADPKRSTDVKTKVSETEIVAGRDGSLTVAEPLTRVRIARIVQSQAVSVVTSSYMDWRTVTAPAATTTEI